jgi:hypothetical protein
MSRIRRAVVALTAVLLGTAGIVSALDCQGRLVTMGASPWDVGKSRHEGAPRPSRAATRPRTRVSNVSNVRKRRPLPKA